jgi:AcrR family transcriptional regulator
MDNDFKKRSRDKDKTRQDLILSGEKLFASKGFEGASLDMIASNVGVNKTLISYHFKNKNGLYKAIIAENVARVHAKLAERTFDKMPPEEALRTYITALTEAMAERSSFASMIIREHVSGAFIANQESAAELLGFYTITESILKRGIRKGVFRKVDFHLFHLSIVGTLIFFLATERFRQANNVENLANPRPMIKEFIDHTTDVLLRGIRADT